MDDVAGSLVHNVAYLLCCCIDGALHPYGLSRVRLLAIEIVELNDLLSQTDLAAQLQLGTTATGKLLDRLEERGPVLRPDDSYDRRTNRLTLTADARNRLMRPKPAGEAIREEVLQDLSDAQLSSLQRLLLKIEACPCNEQTQAT